MTTVNDLMDLTAEELAAVSDEIILSKAYGIEGFSFSEYSPFTPTPSRIANLNEMTRRLESIKAAKTAKKAVRTVDFPNGKTLDCGCIVYNKSEIMNASNGTACSNCYDSMSD